MRRGEPLAVVRDILADGPLPEAEVVVALGHMFPAPYALRVWQRRTWRKRKGVSYNSDQIEPKNERAAVRSARRQLARDRLYQYRKAGHIERLQNNGRIYLQLVMP